jgi:DNA polymerase theta
MAAALDHFSDRLMAGARTDLLALAKLPFVKSRTAFVSGHPLVRSKLIVGPQESVLGKWVPKCCCCCKCRS